MPAVTTHATAAATARRGLIVAMLVVTIGANAPGFGDEGDAFARADAEAEAFAATPEGKEYGEAVGRAFGRDHAATINRCAKSTKRPDLSDFDLLMRIDATGVVQDVLVKPETNLAVCVGRVLKGWKVEPPPRPDAWVKVEVVLKKR
jgi:hypothetical protein